MIAHLRGTVIERDAAGAVVECAGVGYRVKTSRFTLEKLEAGAPAALRVHTEFPNGEIVLYAFLDRMEELLFHRLIGVPGVGGASALAILSAAPPDEIAALIVRRDLKGLTALPRVGKKVAERLIVELADKLSEGAVAAPGAKGAAARPGGMEADLLSALANFGWPARDARPAVDRALHANPRGEFEILFRAALRDLSGR